MITKTSVQIFLLLIALLSGMDVVFAQPTPAIKTGIYGEVREGKYINSVFRFKINLPQKWITLDNEEAKEYIKAGVKAAELDEKAIEREGKSRLPLLSMTKLPMGSLGNATLTISAMKQPSSAANVLDVANLTVQGLEGSPVLKIETKPTSLLIGQKQFATFDYKINAGERVATGKYLVTMSGSYSVTWFLSYENSEDIKIIRDLIDSISFN